jgi:DUF4097 and DUF4098 domain-containing protein YvlB
MMTTHKFVVATLLLAATTVASAADDKVFDKTVAADARGIVEISNVAGKIHVIGWDRQEVSVHANLDSDVERVDVTSSKGRTVVKVVLPNMNWRGDGDAELEVRVPSQSEVQATAVSADVETQKLTGMQRLQTVSGELRAELSTSDFQAKTVSGDMRLYGGAQPINIRVSSVSGDITLDRGAGDIDAETVSGDLRLDMDPARGVRMHSTSGELIFRGSLADSATLEAETVSGDVNLRPRAKGGLEYEASAFSGDINNCFGKEAEKTSKYGPGTRLMGTAGDGKSRVRVRSMSGDVDICDR